MCEKVLEGEGRLKYVLYGALIVAVAFVTIMAYLAYFDGNPGGQMGEVSVWDGLVSVFGLRAHNPRVRPGTIAIAYSGDILGSLAPCG